MDGTVRAEMSKTDAPVRSCLRCPFSGRRVPRRNAVELRDASRYVPRGVAAHDDLSAGSTPYQFTSLTEATLPLYVLRCRTWRSFATTRKIRVVSRVPRYSIPSSDTTVTLRPTGDKGRHPSLPLSHWTRYSSRHRAQPRSRPVNPADDPSTSDGFTTTRLFGLRRRGVGEHHQRPPQFRCWPRGSCRPHRRPESAKARRGGPAGHVLAGSCGG